MTQYDITNRWSGAVIVTAEIDCDEAASRPEKVGLAVKWVARARANLADADFAGANLADADLAGANLADADLARADLRDADLAGANLAGADLADANLRGADLARANLRGANLAGADFAGANLRGADLRGADLAGANLRGAVGNMSQVRSMQIDRWPVTWTTAPDGDVTLQIGCQSHSLALWEKSDPRWIAVMDRGATEWGGRWREPLLTIVKANPAVPFGAAQEAEAGQ